MKTSRVWAATGFLLMTLAGGTASAQNASFTLANNTAFSVYGVYIWPADTDYPGPDRLGNRTIESGESYIFRPRDGGCTYNIRVTFLDYDREEEWDDVDLCNLSKLTLNYNYVDQNLWASTQ